MTRAQYISELPEDIRILAEINRKDYKDKHEIYTYTDDISAAFHWANSPQGHDFWSNIYHSTGRQTIQSDDQIIM